MPAASATPETVVAFFCAAGQDHPKTHAPDAHRAIRERFLGLHDAAAQGTLAGWPETPTGALALILLLDRFPRSAFRGTPRMFSTDAEARRAADAAIAGWLDEAIEPELRPLCYVPFANSENISDQDRSVALATPLGGATLETAERRRAIIKRFGRFPDRNAILGRETREEEQRFLEAEAGRA